MSITLLSGDCRDVLPTLAANSVHCVVTSPPYYGLRDYGTAQWTAGMRRAITSRPYVRQHRIAGTTALIVAARVGAVVRNAAYTTMAMDRVRADAPLFADTPEPQPVPGFAQPDLFAEAAD